MENCRPNELYSRFSSNARDRTGFLHGAITKPFCAIMRLPWQPAGHWKRESIAMVPLDHDCGRTRSSQMDKTWSAHDHLFLSKYILNKKKPVMLMPRVVHLDGGTRGAEPVQKKKRPNNPNLGATLFKHVKRKDIQVIILINETGRKCVCVYISQVTSLFTYMGVNLRVLFSYRAGAGCFFFVLKVLLLLLLLLRSPPVISPQGRFTSMGFLLLFFSFLVWMPRIFKYVV